MSDEPPNDIPSLIDNLMEAQSKHIWALMSSTSTTAVHDAVDEAKRVLLDEVTRMMKMPDVERRILYIHRLAVVPGYFRRADITDAFDISVPQASSDIFRFMQRHPGFIEYNTSTKRYERRYNAED